MLNTLGLFKVRLPCRSMPDSSTFSTRILELQQQLSEARKAVTEIEAFSEKLKGDLADSEVKFSGEVKKLETSISNLSLQRDMLQQQLKETRIDLKKRLDEVQGLQKVVSDDQVEMENLGNNLKKLQNTITRYHILLLFCFERLE